MFDYSIGQSWLSMIDMSQDTKVSNSFDWNREKSVLDSFEGFEGNHIKTIKNRFINNKLI